MQPQVLIPPVADVRKHIIHDRETVFYNISQSFIE